MMRLTLRALTKGNFFIERDSITSTCLRSLENSVGICLSRCVCLCLVSDVFHHFSQMLKLKTRN